MAEARAAAEKKAQDEVSICMHVHICMSLVLRLLFGSTLYSFFIFCKTYTVVALYCFLLYDDLRYAYLDRCLNNTTDQHRDTCELFLVSRIRQQGYLRL